MANFGESPIRVLKGTDDFDVVTYTLSSRDMKAAESVGVPASFKEEQREVMQARCLAHGYKLVVVEKDQPQQKEEII